eukprot:TRINITY_DN4582_c0_g1_i1.p1 TRINITY_DN4582_c0_g1~~TRINITY_DN4582_c0_g1_i1.p1  ORF type:complete len:857 (+),score=352.38 TRINITY_DN4582_c0_g1_i1:106-2571(+)
MPFQINPHLKAMHSDVAHVREAIKQDIDDLEKRIAGVTSRIAEIQGGGKPAKAADGKGDGPKGAKGKQPEAEVDKMVLNNAVQGQVVTRFPPEASGFMHIGHAKAALGNWLLAQKYGGRMIFRFDDTNPEKEKSVFEHAIVEDTRALGVNFTDITFSSDRFEEMLALCTRMIKEGTAYCDDTPVDQMRDERKKRVPSARRGQTVAENMEMWQSMQAGKALGTVVRAKMDMNADNACLRDPVLYRCNVQPHVRTGDKYKVYPTYDFTCPIVDSLDGVTHALRTSEYNDRNDQYRWICKALKMRCANLEDFARLNMEFTVMSKRKLTMFVDQGKVDSWDDPRMPTVKGLLRRGMTVPALKKFVEHQGMSKATNFQEWGFLWNLNKQVIDPDARRYVAVARDYSVTATVFGHDGVEECKRPRHPQRECLGERVYYKTPKVLLEDVDCDLIKEGEEVTLKDWGNAYFRNYKPKERTVELHLHLEGDFKKTKWKVTWVPADRESVPCELREYDHLITSKKPPKKQRAPTDDADSDDDDDDEPVAGQPDPLDAVMNPCTKDIMYACGEEALREVQKGDIIQLERRGFFKCDAVEPHVVLINIPDGHDKVNAFSMRARRKKAEAPAAEAAGDAKKKDGDQRAMSLEEKRAAKKAQKSSSAAKPAAKETLSGASLDIRVGKILEIGPHPDADSLFVEQIDLGSETRTVVSGLRKHYQGDELQGKQVMVLCNLKPAAVRGVQSSGMVLCTSTEDKGTVKVLQAPEGSKPGDCVTFPGLEGAPVAEIPKKKAPELLKSLHTDSAGVAMWQTFPFTLPAGSVKSSMPDSIVA